MQRYDEALAAYDKALALDPRLTEAWLGRGAVLALLDRYDDAFAAYQQALAIDPNLAGGQRGIGNALRELGRLDEAREAYRKAIALEPGCGEFYYQYANTKKVASSDPQLAAMEALAANDAASPTDRMYVHFALGKAYADSAEHERAFSHWRRGNALKRQQIDYDEAAMAARFAAIEEIFTPALDRGQARPWRSLGLPIFVLGMPRSGTTLVEQILASHPDVHGAGELALFESILRRPAGTGGKDVPFPANVA